MPGAYRKHRSEAASRERAVTLWTVVLAVACFVSCAPAGDCHEGARRCVGGELQSCERYGGPLGPIDDPSYEEGGTRWSAYADCGAGRCIAPTDGTPAFCALDASPLAACAGTDLACDGTTLTRCSDGYAVERAACRACSTGASCDVLLGNCCAGGIDATCTDDTQCAAGMRCAPDHYCAQPCGCPEGAACAACAAGYSRTPDDGAAMTWTCRSGFCAG